MLFDVRCYPRRDTGDGVRRPRPGVRSVQGHLHARHLRQHEDREVETIFVGKGRLYNRRFMRILQPLPGRPSCLHASVRVGRRARSRTRSDLSVNTSSTPRLRFKTLDELNDLAAGQVHRLRQGAPASGTGRANSLVLEAERPKLVPYAGRFDGFHASAGIGLEDLSGALRQQ